MPLRWRTSARRGFAAVVAVVVVALVLGLLIDQVSWSRTDGTVQTFDADVRVRADGSMRIRETVRLRFGESEKAPSEQRLLRTYAQGRELEVSDVRLRGQGGRELRPRTAELLGERRLRFDLPGDPDDPARQYLLSYTVRGSATPLASQTLVEHDLLAGGLGREVNEARVTIRGGASNTAGCLTGPSDRRRFCALTEVSTGRVVLGEDRLGAADGLAFSVRFEPALADVAPVRATEPPVATGSVVLLRATLVLCLLLVIGAIAMLRQRSRPRTWLRQLRGVVEPPVGVRPGAAGALLAGTATPAHLTATLFDLVRRGHLQMHGSGEQAVLRQPVNPSSRDELELYEWSLLLKVFASHDQVRLAQVRADAPNWSYELLRELERQVTEGSGWRRGDRATRMQRLGWLVAMGIAMAGYLALALLSVTTWPELPVRDLVVGAAVVVLWSAGCAELSSRTAPRALTLRGRLVFADVDAWARYVDRRGVDEDDPAMGIWAVALGVRPDPIRLPVVPPSERPAERADDESVDSDEWDEAVPVPAEGRRRDDRSDDERHTDPAATSGDGPGDEAEGEAGDQPEWAATRGSEGDLPVSDDERTAGERQGETAPLAATSRIFDDDDDDDPLP